MAREAPSRIRSAQSREPVTVPQAHASQGPRASGCVRGLAGTMRLVGAVARRVHSAAARGGRGWLAPSPLLAATLQQLQRTIADKDARLGELLARVASAERELHDRLAEKDARIADKERELQARVAAAERELQARVADKDARVAAAEHELQVRVAAAERERVNCLALMEARMKDQIAAASRELAYAKYETDVANGILNVRGLFEACLADIWRVRGPSARSGSRVSTTQKLAQVLSTNEPRLCPGLLAYLDVAAADNGESEEEVLQQARKMYDALSSRVHADSPERTTRMPVKVIAHLGRPGVVALTAFVRFTGRDFALYGGDDGCTLLPLRLRPPPHALPCSATAEQLRSMPAEEQTA